MKTDLQLQQDVGAELAWEPSVHAAHIGVAVKDGVVTLSGQVPSHAEKWGAERAAQRVTGVKAMVSELAVQLQSDAVRSDVDIARAAENLLEWTSQLPQGALKVMVEHGWITLSGKVDWQFQRQAASDSVRHLMGVMGVRDEIAIAPLVSVAAVQSDIEAALQRSAIDDAKAIIVTVHGGDVTLAGPIQHSMERETARLAAWGSPGVRRVVDQLELVD
jgi:osmotically-inducible protein OsmY